MIRKARSFLCIAEHEWLWARQPVRWRSTRTCCQRPIALHNPLSSDQPTNALASNYCRNHFSNDSSSLEDREQQRVVSDPYEQALAKLPDRAQIHLDFFGEPVTFFGVSSSDAGENRITNAVASLDGFVIGVASKGKSFTGGGEEEGIFVQGAHSAALAWAELLRHASLWNRSNRSAPMLAYVAVAPMLAQTGLGYVKYVDHLLSQVETGVEGLSRIQLVPLAEQAAAAKDDENMNPREKAHLQALDCLLHHDHKRALVILSRHLQRCPGDGLALSLAMDLAHTVGDSTTALRVAGSVAAYWNERRGGLLRPSIPGYNTASALIALGLAVGGRRAEAEPLATFAMERGEKLAGGVATWALAHILDAEGRTAEGISACANSDGSRNFEACGLLYFDSILSGYGVRFALDREERGRGRSTALRLYDNNYERVLDYTGFMTGNAPDEPIRKAPMGWRKSKFQRANHPKNFMTELFGAPSQKSDAPSSINDVDDDKNQVVLKDGAVPSLHRQQWVPTVEDVLTWLPPTPQLLGDATLLLLRLTLNGTISTQNYRWDNLRNAWSAMLDLQQKHGGEQNTMEFYPLVCIAASLLASSPERVGRLTGASDRLARALNRMGGLLNLGDIATPANDDDDDQQGGNYLSILIKDIVADKEPDFWLPVKTDEEKEDWRIVFKLLASAIDGVYDGSEDDQFDVMGAKLERGFDESWEFDVRPFLEHALVYAACKCGDNDTLSFARSICSRGVTLRPNTPEEWWRYSIVLGLLGDEVASENALQASLAFGGGQGAQRDD